MKINITIQDTNNGHVKVVFEPSLTQLVQDRLRKNQKDVSPAEAYAFIMAQAVQQASQNLEKYDPNKIVKPGDFL